MEWEGENDAGDMKGEMGKFGAGDLDEAVEGDRYRRRGREERLITLMVFDKVSRNYNT